MKIFLAILVNILIVFVLFISGEYYCGHKYCRLNMHNIDAYKRAIFNCVSTQKYFYDLYNNEKIANYAFTQYFRNDENVESRKKPIILMGCSFTWGDGLEDDETMSFKLGQLTKRPIYNRGGKGFGPSHFLYQIKSDWFYEKNPEPEYIIYTFIGNHTGRINKFKIEPLCIEFQPRYKYTNKRLKEIFPKWTDRILMVETYQYNRKPLNNSIEIMKEYFVEAQSEINRHWKNTKLVVLLYPTYFGPGDKSVLNSVKYEMEDTDIIVLDVEEMIGQDLNKPEYTVADGYHPSTAAWDLILPKLIKKLGI